MAGVPLWSAGERPFFTEGSARAYAEKFALPFQRFVCYPTDGDAPAREVAGELRDACQRLVEFIDLALGDNDARWPPYPDAMLDETRHLLERAREGGGDG